MWERASKKQQGKWRNMFAVLYGFRRQNSTVASYSRASSKLSKMRDYSLSVWIVVSKKNKENHPGQDNVLQVFFA